MRHLNSASVKTEKFAIKTIKTKVMKTTLKLALVFVLGLVAENLFAVGNLKLNIVPLDEKKAMVSIASLTNASLNVTITDDRGNIVYYQENDGQNGDYRKVFNFSELDNGTYFMKVASGSLTSERQIKKESDVITVGDEKTVLKPFFGVDSSILRCSYINYAQQPTEFYFYENDRELYTRKLGTKVVIQQALDISQLTKGEYRAVLIAGGEQFTYNIEIK